MDNRKLQDFINKQVKGNIHHFILGVQSASGAFDFAGAAGLADGQRPMTTDTPYYLASITKMYTTTVIMQLYEQGRIDLDKPIGEYLPADLLKGIHVYNGHDYGCELKVYELVSQTSGLPDYFDDKPKGGRSLFDELKEGHDIEANLPKVLEIVRGLPAHFAPGTRARYSDTNFRLLGTIIETVTSQRLFDTFQERIFAPLGLTHTGFPDSPPLVNANPAVIYTQDRPANVPKFLASHQPEGGLISTLAESLTFLRAFFDGKLFDARHFDRMKQRWNPIFFPMQYGYGMMRFKLPWYFYPLKPLPEFIGHSGSTGSFAFYCPAKQLYLAGTVDQTASPAKPFMLMMQLVMGLLK